MKITIVVDATGKLVGAARPAPRGEPDAAVRPEVVIELVAQPGQTLHEIDVADEMLEQPAAELLSQIAATAAVRGILDGMAKG